MVTAEAGWYDDGTGRHRWWDGTRWTDQFVDFTDPEVVLHTDSRPLGPTTGTSGWFDDGRGRSRFFDGRQWTSQTRFSPEARECAGIVVDGRWIHCGEASLPVKDVVAALSPVDAIRRRPALRDAVIRKSLLGPGGTLSGRAFGRLDGRIPAVSIEGPQQLWVSPVRPRDEAAASAFVVWANASAEHYRYRE
ncbi:DUF2510 domain-containing protein [Microbacterium sp. P03]|uniref:DUF2510 domain-containing protein n=1 Tax=Microbacterium sp. P03 TaxID=3366946 RepID=UPI003745F46D